MIPFDNLHKKLMKHKSTIFPIKTVLCMHAMYMQRLSMDIQRGMQQQCWGGREE